MARGGVPGQKPVPTVSSPRDRKPDQPRRVRHGVRLRHREGVITQTPMSQAWLDRFTAIIDPEQMEHGHRYARLGQTLHFELQPGAIVAKVQGTAPQPYEVKLSVPAFTPEQWEAIIDDMAAEAVYLVKFLAGEIPDSIDELLGRHELQLLFPEASTDWATCTCPSGDTGACRHVATVVWLMCERLASDPLSLLTLRGIEPERLIERLRQKRVIRARGMASAHVDPLIPESQIDPTPLEVCAESYWRCGPALERLESMAPAQHVRQALLRRLGPSPLNGKFPLVGLLASIYDTVAEHAVMMRDEAETLDTTAADIPDDEDE